ncbi:DUF2167 domain-containing protein [Novosphingobium resinovorum]|uniref:DUF2167 domain-containing protein n=1 Tax=Novosphingobium resinovorum TaxID=158500 RepID=UPI002ED243AE|nr:DUF2167 domain-containing protein [Novosphingobium resinovorum]
MKKWTCAVIAALITATAAPVLGEAQSTTPKTTSAATSSSAPEVPAAVMEAVKSLNPQRGRIAIAQANATLDLGDAYDFYGQADARKILVQVWGNPPQAGENVLGLVMPAGASPLSDNWGAVVTYEDTGFVSDDDAAEADYAELLSQMQEGEAERNEQRKAQGYPAIHLAGWAETPRYDAATHSVVWAQDLSFTDTPVHTLNYDVRTLGRRGVLSINFISSMSQLPSIRQAAKAFTTHASFDSGSRYADFDASTDKKADYGIGGLVAAGVGLAVAKKLGIFALMLKFIKPILIALVAGFAVLRNRIAALFGRRRREEEEQWENTETVDGAEPGKDGDPA